METQKMDIVRSFEAIVAQYGVVNEAGDMLTREAALQLFDQLRQQETMPLDKVSYYINDVRMEGDEKQGTIIATFTFI